MSEQHPPAPDAESSSPTSPDSLRAMFDRYFAILRAKDRTIKAINNEIRRHKDEIRRRNHLIRMCRARIRLHETWLREESAAKVRKELGVEVVPGFKSRRVAAAKFRQSLNAKHKQIIAAANSILKNQGSPPLPDDTRP